MALKKPGSMEELVYYTCRDIGEGEATVWVFREQCPKCKKALMGKPRDRKGKVLMRTNDYACPECGYTAGKAEYEDSLTASIEYSCPSCKFRGELQAPFKRKNIKGIQTLRFQCQQCSASIDVTKKMKAKGAKAKGAKDEE